MQELYNAILPHCRALEEALVREFNLTEDERQKAFTVKRRTRKDSSGPKVRYDSYDISDELYKMLAQTTHPNPKITIKAGALEAALPLFHIFEKKKEVESYLPKKLHR